MLLILLLILLSDLHIIKFTSSECTILWQFLGEVVAVGFFLFFVFLETKSLCLAWHQTHSDPSILVSCELRLQTYTITPCGILMRVGECIQPCT